MSLLTRLVFPKPAQLSRGLWGRQDLHGRISGGYKVPSAQLFANIKHIPKYVNWLTVVLVASHHLTCGREMPIQPCHEINAKLVIRLSGSVTLQTSGHLHALSWGNLYSLHLQTLCDWSNDCAKSSLLLWNFNSQLSVCAGAERRVECRELPHLLGDWKSCFQWEFMMKFGMGVGRKEFLISTLRDNLDEETSLHVLVCYFQGNLSFTTSTSRYSVRLNFWQHTASSLQNETVNFSVQRLRILWFYFTFRTITHSCTTL